MKISCEIIQDLLPLYFDGVCSEKSIAAIEDHIQTCPHCKSDLEIAEMTLPIEERETNLKEAEDIKELSKKWKEGMRVSLLRGFFSAIIMIAILAFLFHIFIGVQTF